MPRVTLKEYLDRRQKLVWLWQNYPHGIVTLLFHEQRYLHRYFLFTEDLTEQELVQYWHDVRDAHSSLPQQAGKAYKALMRMPLNRTAREHAELQGKLPPRPAEERYSVAGAARAEVDFRGLARMLMEIMEHERGEKPKHKH